jgi:hypothetical protein
VNQVVLSELQGDLASPERTPSPHHSDDVLIRDAGDPIPTRGGEQHLVKRTSDQRVLFDVKQPLGRRIHEKDTAKRIQSNQSFSDCTENLLHIFIGLPQRGCLPRQAGLVVLMRGTHFKKSVDVSDPERLANPEDRIQDSEVHRETGEMCVPTDESTNPARIDVLDAGEFQVEALEIRVIFFHLMDDSGQRGDCTGCQGTLKADE